MAFDDAECCPLCMEAMEDVDLAFYPCVCRYQVCSFCWSKINNEGDGLCPACRKKYSLDQPDLFKPLSEIEDAKAKCLRKRKDNTKKKLTPEMLKILPDLRVVQPNLIFVVGLPASVCKDKEQLKSSTHFGRFGKVYKIEVNQNQTFGGSQGHPSYSAYITYYRAEDAMRSVRELDQTLMNGRSLRVSLGTTKYCSQFLRGSKCNKHECMYLHDLGDPAASFTKEEMQQGKHTEFMIKLLSEMGESSSSRSLHQSSPFELDSPVPSLTDPLPLVDSTVDRKPINRSREPTANTSTGTESSENSSLQPKTHSCISKSDAVLNRHNAASLPKSNRSNCLNFVDHQAKWPSPPVSQSCPSNSSSIDFTEHYLRNNYLDQVELPNDRIIDGPQSQDVRSSDCKSICTEIDIDFDPFRESQQGLAELLAAEEQNMSAVHNTVPTNGHLSYARISPFNVQSSCETKFNGFLPNGFPSANCDWNSASISNLPPGSGFTNLPMNSSLPTSVRPPPGFEDNALPSSSREQFRNAFVRGNGGGAGDGDFLLPHPPDTQPLGLSRFVNGSDVGYPSNQGNCIDEALMRKSNQHQQQRYPMTSMSSSDKSSASSQTCNISDSVNPTTLIQSPDTQDMFANLFSTAYNTAIAMLKSNTSSSERADNSKSSLPPFDMNSFFQELCVQYPQIYQQPQSVNPDFSTSAAVDCSRAAFNHLAANLQSMHPPPTSNNNNLISDLPSGIRHSENFPSDRSEPTGR